MSYVAPKGNHFWKARAKHGRDYVFKTPEALLEAAEEYFTWTDENPMIQTDFRGKDATEVSIPHVRPYTITGLYLFIGVSRVYFDNFEKNLKDKIEKGVEVERSRNFLEVVSYIKDVIHKQKFDGAACGFYSHQFIARDIGLAEVQEIKLDVNPTIETIKIVR